MRALFLDRDGIFNEVVFRNGSIHSPKNWEEIRFFPEMERISEIKKLGFKLVMMTNQPDLERRIISQTFIDDLHGKIQKIYGLDAVYCCPFAANDHPMKKPNPGMFLQAAKDLKLDLPNSFHLGDTDRDVGAAKNAGCKSILWDRPYNREYSGDYRIHSFNELHTLLSGLISPDKK